MPQPTRLSAPQPEPRPRLRSALFQQAVSTLAGGVDRAFLVGVRAFLTRGLAFDRAQLEAELERLAVYTDPAVRQDPDRLLGIPAKNPRFTAARRLKTDTGTFTHFRWRTPYTPVHPDYAAEFNGYDRLKTVHIYAWQHAQRAPASLLLTHGWGAGHRLVHQFEFGVDYLHRRLGLDVYFYVTPFHGLRRPSASFFSGELHPSPNLLRTNEGFIQTVCEIRGLLTAILHKNPNPVGMMGSSLGGYTSALVASLDERVGFVIPVMPPASLADLFWHQLSRGTAQRLEHMGFTRDAFRQAWSLHSPLSYQPRVPWDRRLIITASGDALVPESQVRALWEHWGRPQRVTFPGSHLLQVGRHHYHRAVGRFLRQNGLVP